jgi:hypothetical protein
VRQIGLEPSPDEFVQALVGVFREVRRVLRDDGTVWLNLGDSYAGGPAVAASTIGAHGASTVNRGHSVRTPRSRDRWQRDATRAGLQAEGSPRHPVDGGVRPPRRWLVLAERDHLGEAEPDAGERDGPADEGARVRVPAVEGAEVLLRRRRDPGADDTAEADATVRI